VVKHKPISLDAARAFAYKHAHALQTRLTKHLTESLTTTDDYRIAYEISLTIDILEDDSVIEEIHWELQRGKRSLSSDLGNELLNRLVYTYNIEEPYITLYRKSIQ